MNMQKETTSWILIGHIGVQACAVGAGLTYYYSQRQITPIVLTIEAPRYSMQDILYGAITKPRNSVDLPQNPMEYKIMLVAGTTGSSGDATMVFPVYFSLPFNRNKIPKIPVRFCPFLRLLY